MEKILLITPQDAQQAALKAAAFSYRIRQAMGEDPLKHWQGEAYILVAAPGTVFNRYWDQRLLACMEKLGAKALLTGWLAAPDAPHGPMTVAARGFDEEGRLDFQPGTPMCDCAAAQVSGFIHPGFIFAPAEFFRQTQGKAPLFLAAFEGGWSVYTLPEAALSHPQMPAPPAFDPRTLPIWTQADPMGRFEKKFALDLMSRRLSSAARLGLFTPDLRYDMRPPLTRVLRECLRRHTVCRNRGISPLFVTAFREMACPVKYLPGEYESWFGHLARLNTMPLMLYAKGGVARRVRSYFSNLYEYQHRYGLPVERLWQPQEDLNQFKAGKPFLLARTMEHQPRRTHYAWIDFGYQRWPLYSRTAFDWRPLCDDRIHLARVDGQLDTSLMVVPAQLVDFLCEEMLHEVIEHLREGLLPPEEEMMEEILKRCPREFAIHEMSSRRRLLSLCCR